MDPAQPSQPDSTSRQNDDQIHAEVPTASESTIDLNEVEMAAFDSTAGPSYLGIEGAETSTMNLYSLATSFDETASDSSSQTVPSTPLVLSRTGTRRSRVEDDHDDDRDRRHPSQRINTTTHLPNITAPLLPHSSPPTTANSSSSNLEDTASNPGRLPTSLNSRLNPFHFFRHRIPPNHPSNSNPALSGSGPQAFNSLPQQNDTTAGPSSITPPTTSTNIPPPPSSTTTDDARQQASRPNPRPQYLAGFSITIDMNGGSGMVPFPIQPGTTTANLAHLPGFGANPLVPLDQGLRENPMYADQQEAPAQTQTQPQPQSQGQSQTQPADGARQAPPQPDGAAAFADILARIGLLAALSFRDSGMFDRDVDDPERAKKLVEGLEDVPVGLVQRLERIGGVAGEASENSLDGGLGDGGCAICWERLLLETEDEREDSEKENGKEATTAESSSTEDVDISSTYTEFGSSSADSQTNEPQSSTDFGNSFQRIVSLPCAHVFHAQCLVPWFSKPKQTTCPICRFNIDPENLTYTSRTQRRAAARAQTRTQEQPREEGGGNATGTRQDAGEENGVGAGVGPDVGFDLPMMFGGESPIFIPLSGGPNTGNSGQPPAPPTDPTSQQPQPLTGDRTEDDHRSDANPNTNGNRSPGNDVVTIGFDMYIGRGPPPFALRGPNIIQFPIPGGPGAPATNDTTNATPPFPNPAANPSPQGTPIDGTNATNATTNLAANINENIPNANDNGVGGARGPGGAFAIPIPMSAGFTRAIGDMLSRIFSTSGAPQDSPTQPQPQRPIPFGPERPPAPQPGSMPMPANVGLGFGPGIQGGQGPHPVLPPFVIPFGPRGTAGTNAPLRPPAGQGVMGTQLGQGGAAHPPGFEAIPLFDLIGGMFGQPSQGQAGATTETDRHRPGPEAQQQPAQPQPGFVPAQLHPQPQPVQGANTPHPPAGFGFIWPPGSPPPRPASAPAPRQQAARRKWVPPPAPGLTLRQRVEKKEQEAGLRCNDMSCGVGPSDEDPWVKISQEGMKQLSIRATPVDEKARTVDSGIGLDQLEETRHFVCPHTFHSSCLVSSERVSLAMRDAQVMFLGSQGKEEVEVSCPICRGVGRVSKEDWDEGVKSLN